MNLSFFTETKYNEKVCFPWVLTTYRVFILIYLCSDLSIWITQVFSLELGDTLSSFNWTLLNLTKAVRLRRDLFEGFFPCEMIVI